MDSNETFEQIEAHRREIDALDSKLVQLLNERAEHSLAIRGLKPHAGMELFDPQREERIMQRLESENAGPMHGEDIREIYGCLLKVMKAIKL